MISFSLGLSGIGRDVEWGGLSFEAGRLLTFSAFRVGANSRLGAYSNKYGKGSKQISRVQVTEGKITVICMTEFQGKSILVRVSAGSI